MRQIVIHIPEDKSFEVIECLQEVCGLRNLTKNTEDGIVQLTCLADAHSSGYVMYQLDKIGCGVAYGKIVLIPVSVVKPLPRGNSAVVDKANTWYKQLATARKAPLGSLFPSSNQESEQQELRNKFSRLAVEEIYSVVDGGCSMSADYFSYIFVASMIAAVGLTTNNSVMIVASMLVSPLMGPILGFTYGTAIWDLALIKRGVLAELAGVGVTALIGFIAGLIISGWEEVPAKYGWPTNEMASRGDQASLLVGIFFAVPSGVGVALSATQGGVNSLVGVAIAASLLPPVVNVGMCLAFALVGDDGVHEAQAYFDIAGLSLALFLLNIGVIYVVCLCVFRFKKITPVRRQLSRYMDLPPLKLNDPNLATSSDGGIGSEIAGAPQVVLATPVGLGTTATHSFGGTPVTGTMLELRPIPTHPASKMHCQQAADAQPTKADAHTPTSGALAVLASVHPADHQPPPTHAAPGSTSSACSDLDMDGCDLGRGSSARLLEHMQGQGRAGGGRGGGVGTLSCAAPADPPLPSLLNDDPLGASSGGALLGPAVPALLGGGGNSSISSRSPDAQQPRGGMHAPGVVAAAPAEQHAVGQGTQGPAAAVTPSVIEMLGDTVDLESDSLAQKGALASALAPPQPQPQRHQPRQQRSCPMANEWTLTDETLEHWVHEMIHNPEPITAEAPRGQGSSGQLELSTEEEARLRARWNRLVESHFGVKLEDVEEEEEEGEDSKKHRPSLEHKFQKFLKKLNSKVHRSGSSSSLGSISSGSFKTRFSGHKQNTLMKASSTGTGLLASSTTQQQGGAELSAASFGSSAFAEAGQAGSPLSLSCSPANKESMAGMVGQDARTDATEVERMHMCSHSASMVEVQRGAGAAAAPAESGAVTMTPGAPSPSSPASSGRMTRTPEEAWDLVRKAVLTTSKKSSSRKSSRQSSITGEALGTPQ